MSFVSSAGIMGGKYLRTVLIASILLNLISLNEGFWLPWSWFEDNESGESSGRSGWSSLIDLEDSSEEGDSSVDLEDLVLTISLEGPPKTAKPTTLATTTTDSPTTTKPKQKPKG